MKNVESSMCKTTCAFETRRTDEYLYLIGATAKLPGFSQTGGGAGKHTTVHVGVAMLAIGHVRDMYQVLSVDCQTYNW